MSVDIVVLWVDGSDPAWLAQKQNYLPPEQGDSSGVNRYRDWDLMPYWFRGIERFAPWAGKIWFVTWGHVPRWLNTDAPRLRVVRHSEFIPEAYLPTFSSHTIEMNLHRIEGLSERFVYFNDDMFLLRPAQETDFFRGGLPCTCGAEVPWIFCGDTGAWAHAAANDLGVINAHFPKRAAVASHGKKYRHRCHRWQDNVRTLALETLYPDHFTGFRNLHAPAAYLKRTFEDVWAAEPELLDRTCSHRFRSRADVNQWLCLWWQVAGGQFSPRVPENLVMSADEENVEHLCRAIRQQSHEMICINDPEGAEDISALSRQIREAFETILPEKSVFER